jgi:hypothetical protein
MVVKAMNFSIPEIALGCVSFPRKKLFAILQSQRTAEDRLPGDSSHRKHRHDRTGRWLLRKPSVCGPTVTAGRSNFGHNSRVLGLGGKWTAPGYRAVRRHGLISLPLERGLFVADIVRRPLCNVPHYAARRTAFGRITGGGTRRFR